MDKCEAGAFCEHCRGMWIAGETMRILLQELGELPVFASRRNSAEFSCPDCRIEMKGFEWDGAQMEFCPDCGGAWLSAGDWGELDWRAQELKGGWAAKRIGDSSEVSSEVVHFIKQWRSLPGPRP
jgi:Zn-finger nucleic acid-binding protein